MKANKIIICIFTADQQSVQKAAEIYDKYVLPSLENLPSEIGEIANFYSNCNIYDYADNMSIVSDLGVRNYLPVLQIYAEYENGRKARYLFSDNPFLYVQDRFIKIDFSNNQEVLKYIKALYHNQFGNQNESTLCKFLPFVCNLNNYLLIGIGAYAGYKALTTNKTIPRVTYASAAFLIASHTMSISNKKQ